MALARDPRPPAPSLFSVVDVVLPCLDEAAALPWVLERMPAGYRAIVVDNGSADDSVRVALSYGATVVRATPRGFGAACHAGLLAATSDVVCFMDADASLDPRTAAPRGRRRSWQERTTSCWAAGCRSAARRGRCTPGPATLYSLVACVGVPGCRCTTSARCVPLGAATYWPSASPTDDSAIPSRWS